ncbi:hypothetical protein MSG28_008217 [Choristoneura fumiferana]|uniref:Uncharacterized protein n=1 Tax=Choristoneura fumiferana TaxID=7141 RepID=A0ACC0JAS5_CHOFU|nr:hypothetical protein MSG28_008217 [Choristoneura fumiferana]
MILNGYRFSLHYARNQRQRWQCSRRSYFGCKAVVHTYAVCGDVANGIHYGVYTCESCKSFFKRGVVQQKTFTCSKLSNTCIITPNTRTRCPSCRFMKCKLVGMRTEFVRMSRERGGRTSVKNEEQTWKLSPGCRVYSLKDMN